MCRDVLLCCCAGVQTVEKVGHAVLHHGATVQDGEFIYTGCYQKLLYEESFDKMSIKIS